MRRRVLAIGDSKTSEGNAWPASLAASLTTATSPSPVWGMDGIGVGASTAGYWAANIGAALAAQADNHTAVLVSLGVNDFGTATEAAWKADMLTVMDACAARWPQAIIYVSKPWKRDFDGAADTYAGWVDDIVAARAYAAVGDDERDWLKGADDGATNTSDGVHYSTAGQAAKTAAIQAAMGY